MNCVSPSMRAIATVSLSILFLSSSNAAQAQQPQLEARGIVKPTATAMIATDLVARIARMPLRDGARFKRGDLLVAFDCTRYLQELAVAQAELQAERHVHTANLAMRKHRAIGANDVAISAAKVERAEAQVKAFEVRTAQCEIRAPFDGRLVERRIEPHEMPQANTPLLKIVDDTRFEIDLIVPSRWLRWLKADQPFRFIVDETGQTHDARLIQLGAEVDAVSQTIRVKAAFTGRGAGVLSGMSGTARFVPPQS